MIEFTPGALDWMSPFESYVPILVATAIGILLTFRVYMGGQLCPTTNRLDDKIVIVTGGNSGIGFETCKELCLRSAHVVMTCRDVEKGEKAVKAIKKLQPHCKIEARYLDLRSFDCVRRFVKRIEKDFDRIDVLINNAGIMNNVFQHTTDGFEINLQVNYLAPLLLTVLLAPMLKKSEQGRVVNVSAHAYLTGKIDEYDLLGCTTRKEAFHQRDAFSHSKLAVLMSTQHLAARLNDTSVTVNVCTPGLVRGTNHLQNSPVMKAFFCRVVTYPWMWLCLKTPNQGCQTIIYLSTALNLNGTTGKYFNDCEVAEIAGSAATDTTLIDRLTMDAMKRLHVQELLNV